MGLIYKREMKFTHNLDKVICDCCDREINRALEYLGFNEEWWELKAEWGYYSKGKDGLSYRAILCEKCFDETFSKVNIQIRDRFDGSLEYSQGAKKGHQDDFGVVESEE